MVKRLNRSPKFPLCPSVPSTMPCELCFMLCVFMLLYLSFPFSLVFVCCSRFPTPIQTKLQNAAHVHTPWLCCVSVSMLASKPTANRRVPVPQCTCVHIIHCARVSLCARVCMREKSLPLPAEGPNTRTVGFQSRGCVRAGTLSGRVLCAAAAVSIFFFRAKEFSSSSQ